VLQGQPIDLDSAVANTSATLERDDRRIDSGQAIGQVRPTRRQPRRAVSQKIITVSAAAAAEHAPFTVSCARLQAQSRVFAQSANGQRAQLASLGRLGILIVLAGALSTFSYVTLGGYILALAGFVALGAVIVRDGVRCMTDVDGTAPTL